MKNLKYAVVAFAFCVGMTVIVLKASAGQTSLTLSASFQRRVLATMPEAPFPLRLFITAVKTDSRGRIITGFTSDPVKEIVGQEPAGERG